MQALALCLCATLSALAALHVYWALGGRWPATDDRSLAATVLGVPGASGPPPVALTLAVAVALGLAGLVPLLRSGVLTGPLIGPGPVAAATAVGALVFLLRGVASYIPPWRAAHRVEPFATEDRTLYGPLCLGIGAGFAVLWFA